MARALIVGCGCRGTELGNRLAGDGWQVRGTSRSDEGLARIAAAGVEPALADPDRVGTVLEHVGDIAVVVWALGSARGSTAGDVNGPRLERVLERLVDTPVRGFVYEAAGSLPPETLTEGAALCRRAEATWRLPVAVVDVAPEPPAEWTQAMAASVNRLLG
ncbi:hypothetical protein BH24ACT23_BH24ACT23_09550 [soil metagenome]